MLATTVLKIFLACIALLAVRNLIRSLSSGAIQFGNNRLGIFAYREKSPRDFWLIFATNTVAIGFLFWLVFR